MAKEMSRRSFLKTGAAAALGLAVVPSTVLGKKFGYTAPSDKLNILGVGVGGRGAADLQAMESQNIIGLCDVDWKYADHVFKRYPAAKKYNDYRRMYDELLKEADAVMVATADHTHAIIAAEAMTAGKHVYVEKPLTHSVYESRLLTKLAAKYRVATQMGNQGASGEGVRKICEWIWNGEIGEVKRVETFTDRPIWPQGLARPEKEERVPKTMNWDAFIGPAALIWASRFVNDSRDTKAMERMDAIDTADGVAACQSVRACSRHCPRGIDVGEEMWQIVAKVRER